MVQTFETALVTAKRSAIPEEPKPINDHPKLAYVDSLRGIAVLMVILVHIAQKTYGLDGLTKQTAMYGQMGVQLFFVLSAYTLCLSFDRRKQESRPLLYFYVRRYFRIAPLYYLGILLYFGVNAIMARYFNDASRINDYTLPNIISNIFFYHGFYPPAINNIVLGGWSIGTEMAFYGIFPFLFAGIRKIAKNKFFIFFAPPLGLLLSLAFFIFLSYIRKGTTVENDNVLYYNLSNQLPVFLLGICYYFYEQNFANRIRSSALVSFAFFGVLTIITIYLFQVSFNFTLVPFLAGLSFVFLMAVFKQVKALNHKLLQRIGQVSFSMYILHFLFAYYGTEYATKYWFNTMMSPVISAFLCFCLSATITFLFALLTERLIERRGVKMGKFVIAKLQAKS